MKKLRKLSQMKIFLFPLLFFATPLFSCAQFYELERIFLPHAIYDEDNRQEVDAYPDRLFRDKSKSVAAMVRARFLRPDYATDPENFTTFTKRTLINRENLCEDERFSSQNTLSSCTGFLVASDVIATAGHCLIGEEPCRSFRWVFGFKGKKTSLPNKDIYKCKEIISDEFINTKFHFRDYALIKLDREVSQRRPLEYRREGLPPKGTELIMIGHPMGISQKITDGAQIKEEVFLNELSELSELSKLSLDSLSPQGHYFIANLDSYSGNSGSPVFNRETGLVEGIAVEGADDFSIDKERGCLKSIILKEKFLGKAQELIFPITEIDDLKKL